MGQALFNSSNSLLELNTHIPILFQEVYFEALDNLLKVTTCIKQLLESNLSLIP